MVVWDFWTINNRFKKAVGLRHFGDHLGLLPFCWAWTYVVMIYSQDPYSDDSLRRVCVLMLFLGIQNVTSWASTGVTRDPDWDHFCQPATIQKFSHSWAPILGTRMDFPETTVKNKNPPLFWPGIHSNMRQDHQTRGFAEAHGFHTSILSMFWLSEFNSGLPWKTSKYLSTRVYSMPPYGIRTVHFVDKDNTW